MVRKFSYLLVLFIAVYAMLTLGFGKLANQKSDLLIQFNTFRYQKGLCDILFLGDSHTQRSVDLSQIPNSFSLAYYGENNIFNYYKLKYCLENLPYKPKYVVLPCDAFIFSKGARRFRSHNFFYSTIVPLSELKNFEERPNTAYYNYCKARLFPFSEMQYAFRFFSNDRLLKGQMKFSDRSEAERKANARFFVQTELLCGGPKENLYDSISLSYIPKMIELCRQYNIQPIYIKYPLTRELLSEIQNSVDPTALKENQAEKIVKQYEVPVLNFETLFENDPTLFFDCHHLNTKGKMHFTPQLMHSLDSLQALR